jgi:tetratricopeptide (TPR) repeat protein
MSLLKRIFGGRSAEDERAHGDKLFAQNAFGEAKLAFERALEKVDPADAATRTELRERVDAACDGMAEGRLVEGEIRAGQGELDLARAEYEGALEIAVDADLRERAQDAIDRLERDDALQNAEEVEISDEDRLAALAGTWEEAQAEEYDTYGEDFGRALLLLHDGDAQRALDAFDALLDEAEEPRYLWFEVGRACFAVDGRENEGEEHLRTFLECMDDDEGGESRLVAHMLLAKVAEEREDQEAAIAELERAAEALDDDPRPYLELGRYLRAKKRAPEAIEVLELAASMGERAPGWPLLQELGLAYADAERDDEATETLESVIATHSAQRNYDFPHATAVALATLHEKAERFERAADLYRCLTKGSDRERHMLYHYEAGRLLTELGLADEARRMLKRASALAEQALTRGEKLLALSATEAEAGAEQGAIEPADDLEEPAVSETSDSEPAAPSAPSDASKDRRALLEEAIAAVEAQRAKIADALAKL